MDARYVNDGVDIIEDLMELQEAADIVGPTGEEMVLVAHDQGHGTLQATRAEGHAPQREATKDDVAGEPRKRD